LIYQVQEEDKMKYEYQESDDDGALVVLTVDVVYKNQTFKNGDLCKIFWVGADKHNQKNVRLGLERKSDFKTFFCSASAVQRYVKYPTAPFEIGDRLNYRGKNGTVFFVKQQQKNTTTRIHNGGWRTVITGAIGDWLIGVNWENQIISNRYYGGAELKKWLFADGSDLVQYKVSKDEQAKQRDQSMEGR